MIKRSNQNKLTKSIALTMIIASFFASQKLLANNEYENAPIIINGQISVENPVLDINSKNDNILFIEEFKGQITKNSLSNVDCEIIFNESLANQDKNYCYIYPKKIPQGIYFNNGELAGYFKNKEDSIIVMSMNLINPIMEQNFFIQDFSKTINIIEVDKPVINNSSFLIDSQLFNESIITKKPNKIEIKNIVNNSNYKQSIFINNEKKCIIDIDYNECTAIINTVNSGKGEEVFSSTSSINENIKSEQVDIKLSWNFLPPEILGYSLKLNEIENNQGSEYIENNKLIVKIKRNSDKLNIKTSELDLSNSYLLANGIKLTPNIYKNSLSDEFIYIDFNLTELPDNTYDTKLFIQDMDGNKNQKDINKIIIDKTPPLIIPYLDNQEITVDTINIYDFTDIKFKLSDTSDSNITSITSNGENIEFEKNNDFYILKKQITDITKNDIINLTVQASDFYGNKATKILSINQNNGKISDFKNSEYIRTTENINEILNLTQFYCNSFDYYSKLSSSSSNCFIEFKNFDNLNPKIDSNRIMLNGFFNSNNQPLINIYYKNNKNTIKIKEKTFNILIKEPEPPVIEFLTNLQNIGNDTYLFNESTTKIGEVLLKINGDIDFSVSGKPVSEISSSITKPSNGYYKVNITPNLNVKLWEENDFEIKAFYKNDSNVKTVKNIKLIKTLNADSVDIDAELQSDVVLNTEDIGVSVYFGKNEGRDSISEVKNKDGDGWIYNSNIHGEWDVYLAEKINNEFIPITESVKTVNSKTDFMLPKSSKTSMIVYPIAEMNINGKLETKIGYPLKFSILEGGQIKTSISSKRFKTNTEGLFIAKLDVIYPSLIFKRSTDSVKWFVKEPNSSEYKIIENTKNANRIYYKMDVDGDYLFKVETRNKFTGELHNTEEHAVLNYQTPEIKIESMIFNIIGEEATAYSKVINGFKDDEVDFQYSFDKGVTWLDGKNFSIMKNEKGGIQLHARAKLKRTPAEYKNGWTYNKKDIIFVEPKPNNIKIKTDKNLAIIGEDLELTVELKSWYNGIDPNRIKGVLTLNDGKKFDLNSGTNIIKIDSVTKEMIVNDRIQFKIESMLTPYESTKREFIYAMKYFEYIWPEFNVIVKQNQKMAPSIATVAISPSDINFKYFENITYDWVIPEGVEIIKETNLVKNIKIDKPGRYNLIFTVKDEKGNQTKKEIFIETFEVEPIVITVNPVYEQIMNEPASASFKVISVTGGHPNDSIASYSWKLNGVDLGVNRYNVAFNNLSKGDYEVEVTVNTKLGISESKKMNFGVLENKLPNCTVESLDSLKTFNLNAKCTDEDGKIIEYKWLDDKIIYLKRQTFALSKTRNTIINNLKLQATDDSFGTTTIELGDLIINNGTVIFEGKNNEK